MEIDRKESRGLTVHPLNAPHTTRGTGMPNDNLGTVHRRSWDLGSGQRVPAVGDIFVTSRGTGYLVNAMKMSRTVINRLSLIVTRVDPTNPLYAAIPKHEWNWGNDSITPPARYP